MPLALASRRLKDPSALASAGEAARRMGFAQVFASAVPRDAARAKDALKPLGVTVAGVASAAVEDAREVRGAVAAAARAAAELARPLVVVDLGPARRPATESPDGERAVAATVESFVRELHAALSTWAPLAIALRVDPRDGALVRARETEWLLDALRGRAAGLWLDPARVLRAQGNGGAEGPVAFADRFASRTLGVTIAGAGDDGGGLLEGDGGIDWGTLRQVLPGRVVRVLDVGPLVPEEEVVDARRRFEETLGW
jgi:hypothetical protein